MSGTDRTIEGAPIEVRVARGEDFDRVADLFARVPGTTGALRREAWERALAALTWVALERDRVVGFAMVKAADRRVLLHLVAVDESVQGRGVASRLIARLRAWASCEGCSWAHCNIHVENHRTLAIARRRGGEELYRAAVVSFPWSSLERLPVKAERPDIREMAPERDEELESALDIWPGTLRTARGRGGLVLGVFDARTPGDAAVGLACWDPARGGVFPLEVTGAEHAGALLAAVRDSVPDTSCHEILLHLKNRPSIVAALLEAGGTQRDAFVHFRFSLGG